MTKTAFITGATAGFGAAATRRFVAAGWRVIGTGRRAERLASLAAELGEAFLPLELDMRDMDGLAAAANDLPEVFGGIDLLINNAGLAPPLEPLQESQLGPALQSIETNVTGLVASPGACCRL
jgi:serine 3-dehydrogenase